MFLCVPSNVGADKDNADPHDDEERLEGDVVLEAGHGEALGRCDVVHLPPALPHEVGVVSCRQKLTEKHLKLSKSR